MPEVLISLGQQCAPDASWAAVFEANMMDCLGEGVSFYYPPHVEEQGIRCWHPYTPRRGEEYDRTHRPVTELGCWAQIRMLTSYSSGYHPKN